MPTISASDLIAAAIRKVTSRVQKQLDTGNRSNMIDAEDVVEILLAIADAISPEFSEPE